MSFKPYTLALALTTAFSPAKALETFPPGHPIYDDPANGHSYLSFDCPEPNKRGFVEARQWSAKEIFRAVTSEPRASEALMEPRRYNFALSPEGTFLSLDSAENLEKIQSGEFPVGYHKDDANARHHQQIKDTCFPSS